MIDPKGYPFKHIQNDNLESFKLIQPGRRHFAFQYLTERNLEAFKLIPEWNRYKLFKWSSF